VSRLVRALHREPPAKVENTLKELRTILANEGSFKFSLQVKLQPVSHECYLVFDLGVAPHNETLISGNCIGGLIQICSSMYSPAQTEATIAIRELIQHNGLSQFLPFSSFSLSLSLFLFFSFSLSLSLIFKPTFHSLNSPFSSRSI
jgi:hypothetical protein